MAKFHNLFVFISFILIISCKTEKSNKVISKSYLNNTYATKFQIEQKENYKILRIFDPWQNADNILFEYYLADDKSLIPKTLIGKENFIKTPVKKIVCLSTTHIGFIDALGEIESISGIANGNLVNNNYLVTELKEGTIQDIGNDRNLNYEQLLKLNPDLILAYGVGSESLEYIQKLNDLGLKVVIIAEYLEANPLAKTEWLKVIASFYNKEIMADSILNKINNNYLKHKELIREIEKKPIIITGLPWKGVWYIPGGNSYLSNLISDAGGINPWRDNNSIESLPYDFEVVFKQSQEADIWINTGAANNLNDIIAVDERLRDFNLFVSNRIYNNNLRQNIIGGNDYWESGIMKPDIILKDLIKIFHPSLLQEHNLYYYKKIE